MRGAAASTVERALRERDPLPGTDGFAGELDGRLVRDVLGRVPLFAETDGTGWSHDPTALAAPRRVPAGSVIEDGDARQIWELPAPDPVTDRTAAVEAVRDALDRALAGVDDDGLAVAFSGGVDSGLLAAALDAPLYTVGFPGSQDLENARSAAALLDRELRVVELDHDRLVEAIEPIVAATGRTNAMDVQIALPVYLVAARAAADGIDRLALGQGVDELFGGYVKVADAPDDPRVEADTVRGARRETVRTLPDQLERDGLAVRAAGVAPVTPLAHDAVIEAALALPGELIVGDRRKEAFRRAASEWLPPAIADRDKTAVQYGSLVARELDRLAL
ncbi:asparagine synthase [Halobacteriales archaeon QH_10_67_13]|nr:MAG: asparagine synthase [Halobacteriales archaeon QH_10_67_13]